MRRVGRHESRRGVSLPEVLVVVSIIALAVTAATPSIGRAVRAARVRSSASQFMVSLKAARMIAVTQQAPVDVIIEPAPENSYRYTDAAGRVRNSQLPVGVTIQSSISPIRFRANGSLEAAATTTLEARLGRDDVETWEIRTNLLGVSMLSKR